MTSPNQPSKGERLLLYIPMLAYMAVACFWFHRGYNPISGDEPHYLFIADSLVRDFDAKIDNNYREDEQQKRIYGKLDWHTPPGSSYSIHGIGIPMLLAIPFALLGTIGAKLLLCILAGLLP